MGFNLLLNVVAGLSLKMGDKRFQKVRTFVSLCEQLRALVEDLRCVIHRFLGVWDALLMKAFLVVFEEGELVYPVFILQIASWKARVIHGLDNSISILFGKRNAVVLQALLNFTACRFDASWWMLGCLRAKRRLSLHSLLWRIHYFTAAVICFWASFIAVKIWQLSSLS